MVKRVSEMTPGETGIVVEVEAVGSLRRRILDMGILPGVQLTLRKAAPMGDPLEIHLRGYALSIRKKEGSQIFVEV